jgi:hypothetical protein
MASGSRASRASVEGRTRERAIGGERARCKASAEHKRSGQAAMRERQRPGKRSRPHAPCIGAEDGGAGHHVTV